MQRYALGLLLALLLAAAPVGAAADDPPRATTRHQFRVTGLAVAAPFELVQGVVDFPAGSWTGLHTHAGQVVTTVLAGEIVKEVDGKQTRYKAGESWSEAPADPPHRTGNPGTAPAVVLVAYILPKGARNADPQPGGPQPPPPAPVARHAFRADGLPLPASFEVVQLVADFPVGAVIPLHTAGGQATKTVLAGELAKRVGGTETRYQVGESWFETPAEPPHTAVNVAATVTTVVATYLVPTGGPILTLTPGMPSTGGGGAQLAPQRWLAPLVVIALLVGSGLTLRRRLDRH
jgi:quercetin dioxygenase-like cupin family protein